MKIKELPKISRPREKAWLYGVDTLTDDELLAIIIGSGIKGHSAIEISKNLLNTYYNLNNLLLNIDCNNNEIKGLSKINSLKLQVIYEIFKRLLKNQFNNLEITNINDILIKYDYLRFLEYEEIILLIFDNKNNIVKELTLNSGSNNNVYFQPSIIIKEVLKVNASSCILIHNHPDGNCDPSDDDIISTTFIKDKLEEFNIDLIEHIIFSKKGLFKIIKNSLIPKRK